MQNAELLPVKSVKGAKNYVKRVYPKGGTIYGYLGDERVYQCVIMPQHEKISQGIKGMGGRSVYSDRWHNAPENTYPKPELFFFQSEVFDFSRAVERPDAKS